MRISYWLTISNYVIVELGGLIAEYIFGMRFIGDLTDFIYVGMSRGELNSLNETDV